MIRGNIAIPSAKSLRRSRPKRRRELPADLPVIFENVRSPQEIAKERRRLELPIHAAVGLAQPGAWRRDLNPRPPRPHSHRCHKTADRHGALYPSELRHDRDVGASVG